MFKANNNAQRVYKNNGFEIVGRIHLAAHELMPRKGGCVLMKARMEI